jgi:hypothetical protein
MLPGSDLSTAIESIFGDDGTYYRVIVEAAGQDGAPFQLHQDVHLCSQGRQQQERHKRLGRVHAVGIDHGCVTGELRIEGRSAESCSNFVSIKANSSVVQVGSLRAQLFPCHDGYCVYN